MEKQAILLAVYRQYGNQPFMPKQALRETPTLQGVGLADMVAALESQCSRNDLGFDFAKGVNPDGCLELCRHDAIMTWAFKPNAIEVMGPAAQPKAIEEAPVAIADLPVVTGATAIPLPALQGTEKQVKRANDLRAKAVASLERDIARMKSNQDGARRLLSLVLSGDESLKASFWIENRSGAWSDIIENRMVARRREAK